MKISASTSRRRHSDIDSPAGLFSENVQRTANGKTRFLPGNLLCYILSPFRRFMLSVASRKRTLCCVFLFLTCGPYLLYYLLSTEMGRRANGVTSTTYYSSSFIQPEPFALAAGTDRHDSDETEDLFSEFDPDKAAVDAFNRRLAELNRIRVSLLNELRTLEEKRTHLRTEIDTLMVQSDRLQSELRQGVKDLEQVRISIQQANLIRRELSERNTPEISLPKPLFPPKFLENNIVAKSAAPSSCSMVNCFDYSRCSITAGFPVYVYAGTIFNATFVRSFSNSVYAVQNASLACVFLVLLNKDAVLDRTFIRTYLPYWNRTGDGANHLVMNGRGGETVGRSMIVRDVPFEGFRFGFDVLMPSLDLDSGSDLPEDEDKAFLGSPPMVPLRRRYLFSIFSCPEFGNTTTSWNETDFISSEFRRISSSKTDDRIYCSPECRRMHGGPNGGDTKADAEKQLEILPHSKKGEEILAQSTFSIIIISDGHEKPNYLLSLLNSLKMGAVPVLLINSRLPSNHFLPLGETLDWRLSTIQLPLSRLSELHFYLRTISDSDIARLRHNGRLFYQAYFSSNGRKVESILAALRHRLNIPAAPVQDLDSNSVFNETHHPKFGEVPKVNDGNTLSEVDEYLGPVEAPNPSPRYQQNFSLVTLYSYELWNVYADPFRMYPQFPFTEYALPSEAKFQGSPYGFRPINGGAGGSGKEFSESLGGNFPREQFTVVLLTYEREQVLIAALNRLNNLPYLNKIIVVWNGPSPPNTDSVWPKISAPIVVIKPEKNSLNNRFLPYREIETEAVLSIDDDVHLRRDEIIFGFRVWREARDRIVGFPARYHAWNSNSWSYNSNHSCELSMILTGAAFIHKYYFYAYTYSMPAVIRRKVDELMNCEDIAMNFLVSHITRKPPLKVQLVYFILIVSYYGISFQATSRWTFRCPGCPETLSADETHFLERHDCINYFTMVYGYNPLLNTQFRVDSILFKMRIPQNHQKCFKFI